MTIPQKQLRQTAVIVCSIGGFSLFQFFCSSYGQNYELKQTPRVCNKAIATTQIRWSAGSPSLVSTKFSTPHTSYNIFFTLYNKTWFFNSIRL
jgi:hypothetical protein